MADEILIEQLKREVVELKKSPTRLLFKSELLRYPPLAGKHPNEEYQKLDITRAINRNRYGLFLDMGLGKAYISAAIIAHLRHYNKAHKVLLISSNIGAANMVHELLKFMYIDPEEIICMTKVGKDRELFKNEKSIVITNYNTFRNICNYYYDKSHPRKTIKQTDASGKQKNKKEPRKEFRSAVLPLQEWLGGQPGILLLDESHSLADNSSQQTKHMVHHLKFFEYRYLFTGTPADKNEKLYTQCKILDASLVHNLNYNQWCQEYNKVGNNFSPYAINPNGWRYEKIKELNEKLTSDYVVFRKASDCLDIPKNYIKKMYVELTKEHRFIYEAFVRSALDYIQSSTGGLLTRDIINAFPYLQLALDNPDLLIQNHPDLLTPELRKAVENFNFKENAKKIEVLEDIVAFHAKDLKEKGIVWIWHPDTAYKLQEVLKEYNPLVIIGDTPEETRQQILQEFREGSTHRILIASILVLNTSVTLTQAKFQVYVERVYNYSQYTQSIARISRHGQDQQTYTYPLIYDNSIDVVLSINLDQKDILTNKLVSKGFLTQQEWKKIFNCTEYDTF